MLNKSQIPRGVLCFHSMTIFGWCHVKSIQQLCVQGKWVTNFIVSELAFSTWMSHRDCPLLSSQRILFEKRRLMMIILNVMKLSCTTNYVRLPSSHTCIWIFSEQVKSCTSIINHNCGTVNFAKNEFQRKYFLKNCIAF